MIELKSCPFCGGEAILKQDVRYPRSGKYEGKSVKAYEVICSNYDCIIYGADNKYFLTEEEATKAWNNRVSGWIPVNGRVPCETSNKWCAGVNSCGKMFAFKESLACNPKSDTWLIPTALFNAEEITHFMYLPEPPEEVNKNG